MPRVATIDQTQLARLFDVTPRHIRRLTADGILNRARDENGQEVRGRFELVPNVRAYCKYLREQAHMDDASETRYVQLRNKKMSADSEMTELRLELFKNNLHKAEDVEFIMTNMLTAFKSRILAIPSRTSRLLIGQKNFQVIYDLQYSEIEMALRELSGYDRRMFQAQRDAYLASQEADPTSLNGEDKKEEDADDEDESASEQE